ncbi:MAG TPA: type II toxin-antitoxin system PemK/MazF family toxin [Longimicrobiaceae bacterium]|nr:type II toxin-antitoxin system PemK/MazF family toxin [Longimicrobiaceae bacterium]
MAHTGIVRRWELYWADLDPVVGNEQGGDRRPVLVVSNDGFNRAFDLVTVISLTKLEGKRRKVYPFEVLLPPEIVGTGYTSIVMPQQIRTISRFRLLERIGMMEDVEKREEIENRLLEHLDIEFEAEFPQ